MLAASLVLTIYRDISRSTGRQDSWRIRRRAVGPGDTAASQELQEQDEAAGKAERIFEALKSESLNQQLARVYETLTRYAAK